MAREKHRLRNWAWLALVIAAALAPLPPQPLEAAEGRVADILEHQETLQFTVKFLIFPEVGTVWITFSRQGAFYLATIRTEPKGPLPALLGNPSFFYQTRMEVVAGGKRLRALQFVQVQERRGTVRKVVNTLDYQTRSRERRFTKTGQPPKVRRFSIPEGVYLDDFLTTFYNLRLQAYGPVRPGARFEIDTMSKRGQAKIYIEIKEQEPDSLVVLVSTNQKLLGSKGGQIRMVLGPDLVPKEVTVVSVFGLGDAVGQLVSREVEPFNR